MKTKILADFQICISVPLNTVKENLSNFQSESETKQKSCSASPVLVTLVAKFDSFPLSHRKMLSWFEFQLPTAT